MQMTANTLERQGRREGSGRAEQRVTMEAAQGCVEADGSSRNCNQDPRPGRGAELQRTKAEVPCTQTVGGSSYATATNPH